MNTESPDRLPYLYCFCCPPNVVRTVAKSSVWAYSLADNGLSVNLYGGNELSTTLLDGSAISLKQETRYPWDGRVRITIEACKDDPFEIMLRIPDWAKGSSIKINGEDAGVEAIPGKFAVLSKSWKTGDVIELDMPMEIKLIEGHNRIEEVRNQVAIKRGPFVYCVESPDLPEDAGIVDVYFPGDTELSLMKQPELLGGVNTIHGKVLLRKDNAPGMYREVKKPEFIPYDAQFVPYFAWSNRGEAEMTVFMPVIWN